MVLRACQPMIRIAQSYKRLTRSNPEFSTPSYPPEIMSMVAEKMMSVALASIQSKSEHEIKTLTPREIQPIGRFNHLIEELFIIGVNNQDLITPI